MTADPDRAWRDHGFSETSRDSFRAWKIDLNTAVQWRTEGFHDALSVVRWRIMGASPAEGSAWRTAGFESIEALQWHQIGHDLLSASQAKKHGHSPGTAQAAHGGPGSAGPSKFVAHLSSIANGPVGSAFATWLGTIGGPQQRIAFQYAQAGWVSDDALPWAQAAIPPEHAQLWALLGLRPPEAAASVKTGQSALDVVREWWGAGVSMDQVAVWLGAGFTPAEAQQQMAAGVDAAQAAVLRALRDSTDD